MDDFFKWNLRIAHFFYKINNLRIFETNFDKMSKSFISLHAVPAVNFMNRY